MTPLDDDVEWLLVLPDDDVSTVVTERLPEGATDLVGYPSGRPWVVARTRRSRLVSVPAGQDRHLVLLGPGSPDTAALRDAVVRCDHVADLDGIVGRLPGVFHAVLRKGHRQRLCGTACDTRRWFHRRIGRGHATVAASHARLIAGVERGRAGTACGGPADVDEDVLALRLLEPVPHPFADRSPWRGVVTVPAGYALDLAPPAAPRIVPWWSAPEPDLRLDAGAAAVRDAVTASVRIHLSGRSVVSTDLSGGLDSTAVTALAAEMTARSGAVRLHSITARSRDPLDEDGLFADEARRSLRGVRHTDLRADSLPLVYAGLGTGGPVLDEPSAVITQAARVRAVLARARDLGSETHLTGHGGDHLFVGHPTLCRDLLRTRPRAALRRIGAYRGMFGWTAAEMLAQVFGPRSYERWLRTTSVTHRILDHRHPLLTWGTPATLHPWLTERALEAVGAGLRAGAEPLARTPGRHVELDGVRDGGRMVRALAELADPADPLLCAPLLDDRVLEATLAVRIEERAGPFSYKPLLRAATAGCLPPAVAVRTTKGVGSLDEAAGRSAHRDELLSLLTGSRLAALGLIDEPAVHGMSTNRHELADGALSSTVACESWLRSLERPRPAGSLPSIPITEGEPDDVAVTR